MSARRLVSASFALATCAMAFAASTTIVAAAEPAQPERASAPATAPAADFAVRNRVFVDGKPEPVSHGTTIFLQGKVYDVLDGSQEAVVFDPAAGQFTLADPVRNVSTRLTMREIADFVDRLSRTAAAHSEGLIRFSANPRFDEQYTKLTANAAMLTLSSPWLSYEVSAHQAENPAVARQYQEFCDWQARLNMLLIPGTRPPGARLALDTALARRGLVPRSVGLSIKTTTRGGAPLTISSRSEHELIAPLTSVERERVTELLGQVERCKPVEFTAYRNRPRR